MKANPHFVCLSQLRKLTHVRFAALSFIFFPLSIRRDVFLFLQIGVLVATETASDDCIRNVTIEQDDG